MSQATRNRSRRGHKPLAAKFLCVWCVRAGFVLSFISLVGLLGCGGSSSTSSSGSNGAVGGNWQFTLTLPADNSFVGGTRTPACSPPTKGGPIPVCFSGFLLQNNASVTGQLAYSITMPGPPAIACGGSAVTSGTVSGPNVTLTVAAASQTFSLSGTLSADGSTMTGTYNTVATPDCGTAQTGLAWSASLVPPLTGAVQGSIHSEGSGDPAASQEYVVTGFLNQGPNIGANNATVTGTLNFSGYPCLDTASVSGQISGNSVILQLVGQNGLVVGQIGSAIGEVTFQSSTAGGYIIQGQTGFGVTTKSCPSGNLGAAGDSGYICLALGSSSVCAQPLLITPALLTFPAQPVGSPTTSQTIKLTNPGASGATLNNLTIGASGLTLPNVSVGDFNSVPNFTEQDACSSTPGAPFSLAPKQSCLITIFFSPEESCRWIPASASQPLPGAATPSQCPPFISLQSAQLSSPPTLSAILQVNCPDCQAITNDNNATFNVPITGLGESAIQPSTPELDFGPEDATLNEVSPSQSVTFTNKGSSPVQILPAMATPPCGSPGSNPTLFRPSSPGTVPGIQVVTNTINQSSSNTSIQYQCDLDIKSQKPNFDIVSDGCSGTLLAPQQSCTVAITYAPQPNNPGGGLDYFLQLNTLQCTTTITTDCEIDSGRFPVELKSALASPLRLSPGADLNFGTWPTGQTAFPPLNITLSNDNQIANPQPIIIQTILPKGDYAETDNCGFSLAPGSSCIMTITFTPKVIGFDPGSITITYNTTFSQVISLRGFGQ
jgi:hypothetical protein